MSLSLADSLRYTPVNDKQNVTVVRSASSQDTRCGLRRATVLLPPRSDKAGVSDVSIKPYRTSSYVYTSCRSVYHRPSTSSSSSVYLSRKDNTLLAFRILYLQQSFLVTTCLLL